MKHVWLYVAGLMILGIIALGTGPAVAVTGVGTNAPNPSWDQTISGSSRFIVLSNMGGKAVLDKETGLVWEQMPTSIYLTNYLWEVAQNHCNTLTTGGRLGWRLPTLQELGSLVDTSQTSPALPVGHPFSNVQSATYWTATSDATNSNNAWALGFVSGGMATLPKCCATYNYTWCVRGGQGVDPQ
ncbi:MAG TPA: DUF1566 domain-containing protein [Thermodesulfovibrionales bacterium]|nr:DUF1566 domain-containing protein [Thermodesulfovibrionales bacterium]